MLGGPLTARYSYSDPFLPWTAFIALLEMSERSNVRRDLPTVAGTLYRRHGTAADLALARDLLSDGLRYDPTSAAAQHQLGLTCRGLGHREEAESHLRKAVAMSGSEPALPFSECPLLMRI